MILPLFTLTLGFFGQLGAPPGVSNYGGSDPAGLIRLLSNILKITIFASGVFTLINLVISGIQYIGSSGNPDTIKAASSRIWMSMLGLVIIASSLALASIFGVIFFGDASAIINPVIPEAPLP